MTRGVQHNTSSGKDPCGRRCRKRRYVRGHGRRRTGPTHPRGQRTPDGHCGRVRQLQRRLWAAAKRSPKSPIPCSCTIASTGVTSCWEAWTTSAAQQRRSRCRWSDAGWDRRARGAGRSWMNCRPSFEGREVQAGGGEAAVHPEGRWEAATIGDSNGPRPSGPDGDEAGRGTGIRGGLPSVLVRFSAASERDRGVGDAEEAGCQGREPRPGRRHRGLLREHRSRATDEARGSNASRTSGCSSCCGSG